MKLSHQFSPSIFKLVTIFFYRLQLSISQVDKKLASESIQIDAIVPKTPEETRQASVQLNIVEDDENVTSQCCAQTDQPFCTPKIRVFHDIETTIRARKCPNPSQILLWIIHLIFWFIVLILGFSLALGFVAILAAYLWFIGYLFYQGTWYCVLLGLFLLAILLCSGCKEKETSS